MENKFWSVLAFKLLCNIGKVLWVQIKIVRSMGTSEIREPYMKYRVGVEKMASKRNGSASILRYFSKG